MTKPNDAVPESEYLYLGENEGKTRFVNIRFTKDPDFFGVAEGVGDHGAVGCSCDADRILSPVFESHLRACGCLWLKDAIAEAREAGVPVTPEYVAEYMRKRSLGRAGET